MTDSKLIDSSIWLSYLLNGNFKELIENDNLLFLSVLSLFEIKKKLVKNKIPSDKIAKSLDFIKKRSIIISLSEDIAEKAVDFALSNDIPAVDSLIYSSSVVNNSVFYTMDNDFRKLKDVVILS